MDWEVCQFSLPPLDLGQMIGELYQLSLFKGIDEGRWLMEGLVAGYGQTQKLIDSANVQDSWMLKKIRGEQASCGAQEPPVGPLPAVDLACLTTYIECVAAY